MLVLGALGWLMVVIAGFSSNFGTGLGALIFGGLFFLMFVLVYRIMFELVMVIFAIKKNTDRIES
jgi:ABC-type branched-subunit amino acid transport system permease subunit